MKTPEQEHLHGTDIQKTSSLKFKTLSSVQFDENEKYNDYAYEKEFVTEDKVSEWRANKT